MTDRSHPPYELVDAQLHAYSAEQIALEGHGASAEDAISMMDAVGVAAAVLVHPSKFGFEPIYSLEAAAAYPDRFGVVGLVDPDAPDLEGRVAGWRARPGLLAIRLVVLNDGHRERLRSGGYDALLAAVDRHDVPLLIFAAGSLQLVADVARSHPDLQIVVDHLGLAQPPLMQPDPEPFQDLPSLLELAAFPNVAVKASGVPTLSRQPFPFRDVQEQVRRVLDAFGVERVMWGTDITRVQRHDPYPGLHTYFEAVSYLRDWDDLSVGDKALLMGENVRRILRWPRPQD